MHIEGIWESGWRIGARPFDADCGPKLEAQILGDQGTDGKFGCEQCWPPAADAAWKARGVRTHLVELIDESHFRVMILACSACKQRFVSVFTESIDWADGDDPQYWTLLPITAAEAADLVQQRGSLNEANLNTLGRGRKSLRRDYPKGVEQRIYWGSGIHVGMHD